MRWLVVVALAFSCVGVTGPIPRDTFLAAGNLATQTLVQRYYDGLGEWRECDTSACGAVDSDWGADSLTSVLYLRFATTRDVGISTIAEHLIDRSLRTPMPCEKGSSCPTWSDTIAWNAVASMREFDMTHDQHALEDAASDVRFLDHSSSFGGGACQAIPFQQPRPSDSRVKTLETTTNVAKAELLLYEATGERSLLDKAKKLYARARYYFYDKTTQLYTVHVSDDGRTCLRGSGRYFASVNGTMIDDALMLAHDTRDREYLRQGIATARAVDHKLSDGRGVFVDFAGPNDVVEPLVEAMWHLAQYGNQQFAKRWILRNALAALDARSADGTFARFFDGPAQSVDSSWQSNGGLSVEIAAAALMPLGQAAPAQHWRTWVASSVVNFLPATISVNGSGFALIGDIGPEFEHHHIAVAIDGRPVIDSTGLWENRSLPDEDCVRFVWMWKKGGHHVVNLRATGPASGNLRLDAVVSR